MKCFILPLAMISLPLRHFNKVRSVLILMNGSDKEVNLPLARYAEVLRGKTSGKEILTGKEIPLGDELSLAPKGIFVLEM